MVEFEIWKAWLDAAYVRGKSGRRDEGGQVMPEVVWIALMVIAVIAIAGIFIAKAKSTATNTPTK
jgi:hypothetical protein